MVGQSFHWQTHHWDFSPKSQCVCPPKFWSWPQSLSQVKQPKLREAGSSSVQWLSDSGFGYFYFLKVGFFPTTFRSGRRGLSIIKYLLQTRTHMHSLTQHPTHSSHLCKNLKLPWCEGQEMRKPRPAPGQTGVYVTLWVLYSAQFHGSCKPGVDTVLQTGKLRHGGA